jgi:hypothetical protein
MKSERGMVTLMTVFSGIAALMCLLVGIQLFFLESQIGRTMVSDPGDRGYQYRQWKGHAHTGAIMSLGAGVLISLFGLRHHTTARRTGGQLTPDTNPGGSDIDLESVSVRVFDVDAHDRSIEITPRDDSCPPSETPPPLRLNPDSDDPEEDVPDPEPVGDPTDSIVRSIHAAAESDPSRNGPLARALPFMPAWLRRHFQRRGDR